MGPINLPRLLLETAGPGRVFLFRQNASLFIVATDASRDDAAGPAEEI